MKTHTTACMQCTSQIWYMHVADGALDANVETKHTQTRGIPDANSTHTHKQYWCKENASDYK